jgi:cytochrome c biogenesis protein CcdA
VVKNGVIGAFFLGILGGTLSHLCSTPVLISILTKSEYYFGIWMLLIYSIAHCILIGVSGTSIGFVESLNNSNKTLFVGKILKTFFAIIILLLWKLLLYTAIYVSTIYKYYLIKRT